MLALKTPGLPLRLSGLKLSLLFGSALLIGGLTAIAPSALAVIGGACLLLVLIRNATWLAASCFLLGAVSADALLEYRVWVGSVPISPLDIAALAGAIVYIRGGQIGDTRNRVVLAYGILCVIPVVISLLSQNELYSILQDLRSPVFFIVVFIAARRELLVDRNRRVVYAALVLGACVGASTQFFTLVSNVPDVGLANIAAGVFGQARNPALNASLFGSVFLLEAARPRPSGAYRWVQPWVLILLMGAVVVSVTRTAWVGVSVGVVVLLFLRPTRRFVLTVVASAIAIGLLVWTLGSLQGVDVASGLVETGLRPFVTEDGSLAGRLDEVAQVNANLQSSWLFGRGFGALVWTISKSGREFVESVFVHNGYWWLLYKGGVVLLTAWLVLYVGLIVTSWRRARATPGLWSPDALVASAVALGVAALAGGVINSPPFAFLLGLIFAALSPRLGLR